MYSVKTLILVTLLTVLDTTTAVPQRNSGQNNNGGNNNQAVLTLDSTSIQSASNSDGGPSGGQTASQKDPANFINFCKGKVLTNGEQITGGSCNGIVMGELPSKDNMVSTIILNPAPGDDLEANKAFTVSVQVTNLNAGKFTNPTDTYYAAPQTLQGGKVVGHTHITIQDLGSSLKPQQAPDAGKFVFFKGIDDDGNGKGTLSAEVTAGLPAGNYRVCTMSSSSNHQPVLMPVAQRGAQDDCTKFTVGQNSNQNSNKNRGSANGDTSSNSESSSSTTTVNRGNNKNGQTSSTSSSTTKTSTSASSARRGNQEQTSSANSASASTSSSSSTSSSNNNDNSNNSSNTNNNNSTDQNTNGTQSHHHHRHQNQNQNQNQNQKRAVEFSS